jgi:hypothetical protein
VAGWRQPFATFGETGIQELRKVGAGRSGRKREKREKGWRKEAGEAGAGWGVGGSSVQPGGATAPHRSPPAALNTSPPPATTSPPAARAHRRHARSRNGATPSACLPPTLVNGRRTVRIVVPAQQRMQAEWVEGGGRRRRGEGWVCLGVCEGLPGCRADRAMPRAGPDRRCRPRRSRRDGRRCRGRRHPRRRRGLPSGWPAG